MSVQEYKTILLTDANDEEYEFELVANVEYGDASYCVLLPMIEDADEYIILKENDDGLVGIDDPDELDAVFDVFLEAQEQNA